MITVGEELKRERELRGVSLEQMADETKIGLRFLKAIDSGRLDRIPGAFYQRAYVRAYARFLGLDDQRAVNALEAAHRDSEEDTTESVPAARGGGTRLTVASIAVLGVLVVVTGIWWISSQSEPLGQASQLSLSPAPVREDEPPLSSSVADVLQIREPVVSELLRGLDLRITVTEPCWLEIRADGAIVAQGLMAPGYERQVRADEVRLWLGNAGGVSVHINDRAVRALGDSGEVRRNVLITSDNYRDFLLQ